MRTRRRRARRNKRTGLTRAQSAKRKKVPQHSKQPRSNHLRCERANPCSNCGTLRVIHFGSSVYKITTFHHEPWVGGIQENITVRLPHMCNGSGQTSGCNTWHLCSWRVKAYNPHQRLYRKNTPTGRSSASSRDRTADIIYAARKPPEKRRRTTQQEQQQTRRGERDGATSIWGRHNATTNLCFKLTATKVYNRPQNEGPTHNN